MKHNNLMQRIQRTVSLFFLLVSCCAKVNAIDFANYNVKQYSIVDGMLSNEITAILQDSNGFMWFGTNNGLSRFDGYNFTNFKSDFKKTTYLLSNQISALEEDFDNNIWIGTTLGINILNVKTGEMVELHGGLNGINITSIVAHNDSSMFISSSLGIFRYKDGKMNRLKGDLQNKASGYMRSIFIDSQSCLWISAWRGGYMVYDLQKECFINYPYLKGLKNIIINDVYEDKQNNIWISTWDRYGVFKISNPHDESKAVVENIKPIPIGSSLPVVFDISSGIEEGTVCLATAHGAQLVDSLNNVYPIEKRESRIKGSENVGLFTSKENEMWISMYGKGVAVMTAQNTFFNNYFIEQEASSSSISSIYMISPNTVLLGLRGIGLATYKLNERKVELCEEVNELRTNSGRINSIMCFYKPDKDSNTLLLGSRYGGLLQVEHQDDKIINIKKIIIDRYSNTTNFGVFDIQKDSQNTIWLASTYGLVGLRANGEKYELVEGDSSKLSHFNGKFISSFLVDNKDNLWLATKNQLYKYNQYKSIISDYRVDYNNINNNEVLCIHQDRQGNIWIGTKGGGLSWYNEEEDAFEAISNIELLNDDVVSGIESDEAGNLWLSTSNSIVNYSPQKPIGQRFKVFSYNEGVDIYSFNASLSCCSHMANDIYFFGGSNGFVSFQPTSTHNYEKTESPTITNLFIDSQSVLAKTQNEWQKFMAQLPPFTKKISLPYENKNITFEFALLKYNRQKSIKYAYKLDGIDKDWIYTSSSSRSVNYAGLPAGNYVFKVKAARNASEWSDVSSVHVNVGVAPWSSWQAYCFYCLLLLGAIYFIYVYVKKKTEFKRALEIEEINKTKSKELYDAKMRFFANVSHEFYTPLTIISCAKSSIKPQSDKEQRAIKTMAANIERLVNLLNQVILFRKIETGNDNVEIKELEVVSFLKDFCEVKFATLVEQRGVTLLFKCPFDNLRINTDVQKLNVIIYNLLSNAFKYNKDNGLIELTAEHKLKNNTPTLIIKVSDTGVGMNEETKKNIYKRFYRSGIEEQSAGIGLSFVNELVEMLGGSISVESTEGIGTLFTVELPIDNFKQTTITSPIITSITGQYAKNQTATKNDDKKVNLLIVDDNMELLHVLEESLSEKFNIYKSSNGNDAIQVLNESSINLILSDVVMPNIDGVTFVSTIKEDMRFSHIPVILLSAKNSIDDKVIGYKAGADGYITKPFSIDVLIANIESLLRNRNITAERFKGQTGEINTKEYVNNDIDKEFLDVTVQYIRDNILVKDFSIQSLYDNMNMSQSTFYRKLKLLTNMSPNELVRKVRIQIACEYFNAGEKRISNVCYSVGFSDPRYFSLIFKKEKGITPSEYVLNIKAKKE